MTDTGPKPSGFRLHLPIQRRLSQIDLREHEEKILLLLALVVSAIVGLIVVGFVAVTERMSHILLNAGPAKRFLSPLLGSLIGGWLLFHFFPDARGSGIPQTRVALLLRNGVIGLRTIIGKFICSGISLGSGVALGREGPSVQIGAGIASFAGRRLGLSGEQVRSLIPVGTAAAVAAAFNTPLAAVLFTLEEILADLHARVVGSVVIGAATSWIVLRLILGDEPLFHVPAYQLVHPVEFLIYAVLGLLGGLVSTVFVKLLLWLRLVFNKVPARWKAYAPGFGGLVVGLLALAVPGVLGVGYNLVSQALNGELALKMMLLLLVLKIVATVSCYSSGNAGGIFGPSLFMGAMLGGAVGQVAHSLLPDHTGNAGAYALVGMGVAFAGIVRTPMTSVIMIFEVTRDYTIIVPLMIANLCSYVLAQRLQKLPIYEALSRQDGIRMPSHSQKPDPLTVGQAMRPASGDIPPVPHVYPDDTLDSALQYMASVGAREILVLDRTGDKPIGSLAAQDVLVAYQQPPKPPDESARQWQLPVIAAITVAAVLIVSGLVFWQRARRTDFGLEAFHSGERLMAQGQADQAVLEFRSALAQNPQDVKARAALGLALVQAGQFNEALPYLEQVAKVDPHNGPVFTGIADIKQAVGDKRQAADLYRDALRKDWPPDQEFRRRGAQLNYATLLLEGGRGRAAISLLMSIIDQRGDDPAVAKKAAELVKSAGTPDQTEEAYLDLANHFPGDLSVWARLGEVRFAANKEAAALDAYRHAESIDPQNPDVQRAKGNVMEAVALDPTRRGLPVRDRAARWDQILERVVAAASVCGPSPAIENAKPLVKKKATSLEMLDQKMEAAVAVWKGTDAVCKSDAVLSHVMAKVEE